MRPAVAPVLLLLVTLCSVNPVSGSISEFSRTGGDLEIRTTTGATVLIRLLKPDLFRIWAGSGDTLVDEGSHKAPIVIEGEFPPVAATLVEADDRLTLSTAVFDLQIYKSPLTLALYRKEDQALLWRELKPLALSENGGHQTLSSSREERFFGGGQQNGSFEFKGRVMHISYSGWEEGDRPSPAPFYMSSSGYGVLRNSWADGFYDFFSDEYLTTTHLENRFDAYYFVGQSIRDVLRLYTELTGRAGLLPRWAYEYGDADCYNDGDNVDKPGTVPEGWSDGPTGTTPDVVRAIAAKYREHDMPGGWILPNDGYGCGYTDLPAVVDSLHCYGFHTGLWTEDGVEQIAWEVGQAGTRAQKLDVAWTGRGYQFAMDANHDAAQGIIDNSSSRPFVWTVMGWAGIQRYAVTWTGDQAGSWDFIRWHIPTLIGSGLSGMVYSTGDVDGIYGGSPETFTRDLQWKCFTPVLMGMSGWSSAERKHPWWFDEPFRSINRSYLKLKMRLMPYMYTLARETEQTGAPIVRGLMWDHPDDPRAFSEEVKHQFFLGRDLLIAPVFQSQEASGGWRENIYLPQGTWIDYWNGAAVAVGQDGLFIDYPVTLDLLPVFVRAGAILPMYPEALYDGEKPRDLLTLDIYPSAHSETEFLLYEDDGVTRAYQSGEYTQQLFRLSRADSHGAGLQVELEPVQGWFEGVYDERDYLLQLHTGAEPAAVQLNGRTLARCDDAAALNPELAGWHYDAVDRNGVCYVRTGFLPVEDAHILTLAVTQSEPVMRGDLSPDREPEGGIITGDDVEVVSRPAEEQGHPLELAFDNNRDSWFRTVRGQASSYGPHELVLSLKKRRLIDGFQIAPRNDQWWKYGQVYEYQLFVGDVNGEWGEPVLEDTLRLSEEMQTVMFKPAAGSLVRFRILSTQDMRDAGGNLSVDDDSYNALVAAPVNPATISEFRLLERGYPDTPPARTCLSGERWSHAVGLLEAGEARLNGLGFPRNLSVSGHSRIDYNLQDDWHTLRVEVGNDDRSSADGGVRFQVYGDDRLMFQTGELTGSDIEKFELDIRGVSILSLRTTGPGDPAIAVWANPTLYGFRGDRVGSRPDN